MHSACATHNINYSTLGVTKQQADDIFYSDMLEICRDLEKQLIRPPYGNFLIAKYTHANCVFWAASFYGMVNLTTIGEKAYLSAQNEARKRENE